MFVMTSTTITSTLLQGPNLVSSGQSGMAHSGQQEVTGSIVSLVYALVAIVIFLVFVFGLVMFLYCKSQWKKKPSRSSAESYGIHNQRVEDPGFDLAAEQHGRWQELPGQSLLHSDSPGSVVLVDEEEDIGALVSSQRGGGGVVMTPRGTQLCSNSNPLLTNQEDSSRSSSRPLNGAIPQGRMQHSSDEQVTESSRDIAAVEQDARRREESSNQITASTRETKGLLQNRTATTISPNAVNNKSGRSSECSIQDTGISSTSLRYKSYLYTAKKKNRNDSQYSDKSVQTM